MESRLNISNMTSSNGSVLTELPFLRRTFKPSPRFSFTLPGFILSAKSGDREIVCSHNLERYLCQSGMISSSVKSRSHLLRFNW